MLTSDGFGLYPKVAQQFWYYTLFQKIIKGVNFFFKNSSINQLFMGTFPSRATTPDLDTQLHH